MESCEVGVCSSRSLPQLQNQTMIYNGDASRLYSNGYAFESRLGYHLYRHTF
jgi:hypothetical protein